MWAIFKILTGALGFAISLEGLLQGIESGVFIGLILILICLAMPDDDEKRQEP